MSRRTSDQELARALQAEHGASYMATLAAIRRHVARIVGTENVAPGVARERIAIMSADELFGRGATVPVRS
jgi:hypothetical protein